MRILLFYLSCILLIASCGESEKDEVYNENNTNVSKGVVYNINEEPINGLYRVYYPNGNVKMEVESQRGIPNGTGKFYDSDGVLLFKGNFINGQLSGVFYNYYEDGNIHNEINYVNGKKDGNQKVYKNDGSLIAEVVFENGEPKNGHIFINNKKVLLTPEELSELK